MNRKPDGEPVFLIPLIPAGPRVRVIKECSRCGNSLHIPEDELPTAVASLSRQAQYALSELLDGHHRINLDGEDLSASLYLINLVDGRILEFKGNLKRARAAYQTASGYPPQDATVYMIVAGICMRTGDVLGAKDAYQKALPTSTDRYSIFLELLTVYHKTKEWPHLAEAYEECFHVRPDLANEAMYYKPYAKACKKSGKQPIGALDFR